MILSLHQILLESPLRLSGDCLVFTELVLPRNAIARKAALKDVPLSRGKRSFARAPFYEKALLKERVDGRFGLKVSITRPLKNPERTRFLRQILATGVESSTDLLAPLLLRHAPLSDVLEEAGQLLSDSIADAAPAFSASGGLDLDSAHLTNGPLTIPLTLTAAMRDTSLPPGPKRREQRKTRTRLYKKGSPAGTVTLQLSVD